MKNSKVITVLEQLNSKEQVQLVEYLSSPLHNKNTVLLKIAETLLRFKDDFSNAKLTYNFLMKETYDKKNQKIERLRNDLTLLFKHFKKFLALQSFLNSVGDQNVHLLKALKEKDLNDFLESEIKKIEKELASETDPEDMYLKYQIHDELDQLFLKKRTRVYDDNLQIKMDAFDHYYLAVKLKEVCEMLNRNAIYDKKYEIGLLPLFNQCLSETSLENYHPLVKLYYATYQMLELNTKEAFKNLLSLLASNQDKIPKAEVRELYIHAQNFCTRKINQGDSGYFVEVFEIYKRLIDNDLVLSNGEIPHTTYKNIVTTALNSNANEWAKSFIDEYKDLLNSKIRESAYNYNLAKYEYEVGSIDEAVKLLQSVNYEDNYYQIDARYLLLKIFYETNEHDSLLYQIDSFKLYLKRNNNFNIKTRELIITFLKILRKTAILKQRKPYLAKEDFSSRQEKLKEQFMSNPKIPYRKWMENIIQNLNQ